MIYNIVKSNNFLSLNTFIKAILKIEIKNENK